MSRKTVKAATTTRHGNLGGIQKTFVGARAVSEDILLVSGPAGGISYIAVLEVGGITYDLKSDSEQARLNELYRLVLCGLNFDVQVLWRSLPFRMAPYLERFERRSETRPEGEAQQAIWGKLAEAHVGFLTRLSERRTLLTRQTYLVVRFSAEDTISRNARRSLFGSKLPKPAEIQERARQELDMRLAELTRRLELLQLSARRLAGLAELARFYDSCLRPVHAATFPLQAAVLDSVDTPPRSTREARGASGEIACSECGALHPAWASFCRQCGSRLSSSLPAVLPAKVQEAKPSKKKQTAEPLKRHTLFPQLADLLAPSLVEVGTEFIPNADEYHRVFIITGLPRTVGPGWLRSLMKLDEPFELCFPLAPAKLGSDG